MDVHVRTGSTKEPRDTSLVTLSLTSAHGEPVCFLMELHGIGKDARTVEKECEAIVEHALLQAEGDPAHRLDGTLKELNGLLKGFFASGAIQDVHMILAILDVHGILHVSHAGRAEAYLVRHGTASQITEYASGKSLPTFVHIASGQLEPRDTVVYSTQRLLRSVTPAQLTQMVQHEDKLIEQLERALEAEGEHAALAAYAVPQQQQTTLEDASSRPPVRSRRGAERRQAAVVGNFFQSAISSVRGLTSGISKKRLQRKEKTGLTFPLNIQWREAFDAIQKRLERLFSDLADPKRRKRAHLLLLASALTILIVVWASVHLMTSSQRSKTRVELEELVEQIGSEIRVADNRRIIGDVEAANAILERAEERAKQVMDNESGFFRSETLELLEQIRSKHEEINAVTRVPPRVVANLGAKSPDVVAQGMIAQGDGEFSVFDRQNAYRVLLNSVEEPKQLVEEELILDGTSFPRFSTTVFLTTGNSVIEYAGDQPSLMKTEDPAGWVKGTDMKAYLRYLYVLSVENKQIYKYERLSNRYSVPVEYNVNGDLEGALDMAIDGNVFVLKEKGEVLKLFRGEAQPFVIRRSPTDVLKNATKVYKVPDGNLYFLDPTGKRVVVVTDGGATGESTYLKQFVLEGEQLRDLKDLYVDIDETHLYLLDEKRMYMIDLEAK